MKLRRGIMSFHERLDISLSKAKTGMLNDLEKSNIILCEHQLFFPYLGLYRLPLMAASEFSGANDVILFVVNDIFYRRNHFTTRKLGIYCKGQSQDEQKKPVIIPCDRVKPLFLDSPPSSRQLQNMGDRIKAKFELTFRWLSDKKGIEFQSSSKDKINERIAWLVNLMEETQRVTENYSDWCILTNIELYKLTNPEEFKRIFFVSHMDLINEFGAVIEKFIDDSDKFVSVTNRVISSQLKNNQRPYMKRLLGPDELPLWFVCTECKARNRAKKNSDNYESVCTNCNSRFNGRLEEGVFYYPDVVAKQVLSAFINPKVRIVGAMKPYSQVVDECIREIYELNVPPRKVLDSKPFFHGLATPEEGVSDATVFGSLIETDYRNIGTSLITSKWDDNPVIYSDFAEYD